MPSDLFYTIHSENAIPLCFINEEQWQEGVDAITANERNSLSGQGFTGKLGEYCLIHDNEGHISKAYIGAGEGNQVLAIANAAIQLPAGCYVSQEDLSRTADVTWSLAQYNFSEYKKQDWVPRVLVVNKGTLPAVIAEAETIFLVRDLINRPTNDLGPEELAIALAKVGKQYDAHFKQWVGNELLVSNLHAIHTVGRASAREPRLLTLTWGDETHPRLTLIGKGVCFDSGGLDLKPSSAMRLMKKDMGGAAHVIGLAQWVMSKQLPVHLRVFIPAVENSVGSDSFRPGDIIKMYNGLTVEVDNTDAEGRLILADAIAKASEEKPDLLIDFATLTGAARAAVGTDIAAMFCNNDEVAQAIMESSKAVDDPIWRLPLFAGYEELLNSTVADLLNASPLPFAGAITAALFLQRFIPKSLPWVHFDIMAWNISTRPGKPEGGEAMALRALMHYLEKTYSEVKSRP
ncbi:leucyl aminopeptidase family protein [Legionella micdadei]|uniref:Leucyl aminopeptidase n=1 Tax=Legionella micdadei TaxID=451 RepID=A0A098GFN2_LEGMI|nr:leucyl aminopeptidase family protein [Legionella micdadei]KTD30101.1 leucine aminopeptidase [Legionella micdadei]NSL18524.1 leucyl aminopeptidase family protein [Legionella micdadei]CEG60296.1 Leucyl aminopeptidase [Legionella micdadei]SCY56848.1 leucyl aminopeptidase [Legionella micdadei]